MQGEAFYPIRVSPRLLRRSLRLRLVRAQSGGRKPLRCATGARRRFVEG